MLRRIGIFTLFFLGSGLGNAQDFLDYDSQECNNADKQLTDLIQSVKKGCKFDADCHTRDLDIDCKCNETVAFNKTPQNEQIVKKIEILGKRLNSCGCQVWFDCVGGASFPRCEKRECVSIIVEQAKDKNDAVRLFEKQKLEDRVSKELDILLSKANQLLQENKPQEAYKILQKQNVEEVSFQSTRLILVKSLALKRMSLFTQAKDLNNQGIEMATTQGNDELIVMGKYNNACIETLQGNFSSAIATLEDIADGLIAKNDRHIKIFKSLGSSQSDLHVRAIQLCKFSKLIAADKDMTRISNSKRFAELKHKVATYLKANKIDCTM